MDDPPIIRSDDLRGENRLRLLNNLRHHGPCTPSQLSDLTGLSAASISTLSTHMIDQGIMLSDRFAGNEPRTSRGRPQSQLSLNPDAGDCVTLTLTVDLIRSQRVNYAGTVCDSHEQQLNTRECTINQILNAAGDAVERVCPSSTRQHLHHIGVAFQGITEHDTGNWLWSPILQHRNVPLGSFLQDRFGLKVSVNNDCRLISEALSHEQRSLLSDSFATILFSHGVGLGLYLDGKPFAGIRSSALELGHIRFEHNGAMCRCGKRGCIEAYCADYGIERMAEGSSMKAVPTGRVSVEKMDALIDKARAGDTAAIQAFTIAGAAIGEGLVDLFTLLDPMPVALVGRSKPAFELMRDGIERIFKQQLRSDVHIDQLLHCIDQQDPLLQNGLNQNSLSAIDYQFSRAVAESPVRANG